jgi:peptidoglycan-associated lipoprotein
VDRGCNKQQTQIKEVRHMTHQAVRIIGIALVGTTLATSGCAKKPAANKQGSGSGAGGLAGSNILGNTGTLGSGSTLDIASRDAFGADSQFRDGLFSAIHFDYDSARIRPSEMPKLEAVAVRLKSNPEKLVVEGHCDERGTAEYNRALGERRAIAARESLVNLGIDPNRITTVSYGEDRPAVMGADDTVHSQNRRCEFVVVSQ